MSDFYPRPLQALYDGTVPAPTPLPPGSEGGRKSVDYICAERMREASQEIYKTNLPREVADFYACELERGASALFELDRLRAAQGEDSARLDWLETRKRMLTPDIAPTEWRVEGIRTDDFVYRATTLREALDVAMLAEPLASPSPRTEGEG